MRLSADGERDYLAVMQDAQNALIDELERVKPDYLEHKDMVDKLVGGGMKLSAAKAFAKEIAGNLKTEPTPRMQPPAGSSGGRSIQGREPEPYLTKAERERMKASEGLTDAQMDEMEATYKRNVAAEAEMRKQRGEA